MRELEGLDTGRHLMRGVEPDSGGAVVMPHPLHTHPTRYTHIHIPPPRCRYPHMNTYPDTHTHKQTHTHTQAHTHTHDITVPKDHRPGAWYTGGFLPEPSPPPPPYF